MTFVVAMVAMAAVLGASLGSFGGLVLDRLPRGVSVVRPASACTSCSTPVAWHDEIPVASFLALRGRCRSCRIAIPIRSLAWELTGALLGGLAAYELLRQLG